MASTPESARRRKTSGNARIRRKNLNINQDKLDRAVKMLGARSETEAIDQALDMLFFRDALLASVDEIAGKGGLENFFEGGYADDLKGG
jgi:hypothetical protein